MKNYKERFDFKTFVRCGMLTALACVLTMVPQIPTGTGGYVHFGDSIIYVASAFLGPICGAVVGAVGHSLADILTGHIIFALPTFIIYSLVLTYQNHRFIMACKTYIFVKHQPESLKNI